MKKLLLVFAALGLMAQFSACTANKAENDAEFVENADVDKIEAEEPALDDGSLDVAGDTASSDNLALDNSLEAALNGEQPPAETTTTAETSAAPVDPPPTAITDAPPADTTTSSDNLAANDLPPSDDLKLDDTSALADKPTETPMDPPATAMNEPTPSPLEATPVAPVEEAKPAAPATTSLKKVSEVEPYAFGDGYVNTIYIARPKETLKQISQTIYGSDKTKELKKINSFLKARAPRAGDKIAYVSPNRPTDSSRTITYYEDTGMIPETYVAQKGDNLRKISKKLLGYDNAWKEVWSTNPIESKIKLAEGETFKYWKSPATISAETKTAEKTTAENTMPKSAEEAVNNIVKNNSAPAEPMDPVLPPPPQAELPPAPPADLPPPPADAMAANTDAMAATTSPDPSLDAAMPPPPPPPDDAQLASPPPPPAGEIVEKAPANEEGDEIAEAGENDMMIQLGLGVIILGAVALVLMKRKKAKANSEMSLGDLGT